MGHFSLRTKPIKGARLTFMICFLPHISSSLFLFYFRYNCHSSFLLTIQNHNCKSWKKKSHRPYHTPLNMAPSTRSTSKSPDSVVHDTFPVRESRVAPTISTGNYNSNYPSTPGLGISRTDASVDNNEGPEVVINTIFNSDSEVETHSEPSTPKYEVRLFGLSQAGTFFHPNATSNSISTDGVRSQQQRMTHKQSSVGGIANGLERSPVVPMRDGAKTQY